MENLHCLQRTCEPEVPKFGIWSGIQMMCGTDSLFTAAMRKVRGEHIPILKSHAYRCHYVMQLTLMVMMSSPWHKSKHV